MFQHDGTTWAQKSLYHLYSEHHWISANKRLYRWEGNYYRQVRDSEECRRIADFCNTYCVVVTKGGVKQVTYPYAKPSKVKEALRWAKMSFEIDPNKLNPFGINCIDGVVELDWVEGKPLATLKEHDYTRHYFTCEPLEKYDPNCVPVYCQRLLGIEPFAFVR